MADARVISDRETGRSKGFAFVSMVNARDAEEALKKMNGQELQGRQIRIDKSTPKGQGTGNDDLPSFFDINMMSSYMMMHMQIVSVTTNNTNYSIYSLS